VCPSLDWHLVLKWKVDGENILCDTPKNIHTDIGGVWKQSIFKVLRQNHGIKEYHGIFLERCLASM
jgi:hypothetical protein